MAKTFLDIFSERIVTLFDYWTRARSSAYSSSGSCASLISKSISESLSSCSTFSIYSGSAFLPSTTSCCYWPRLRSGFCRASSGFWWSIGAMRTSNSRTGICSYSTILFLSSILGPAASSIGKIAAALSGFCYASSFLISPWRRSSMRWAGMFSDSSDCRELYLFWDPGYTRGGPPMAC